jgi:hypothetical protein
MNRNVVIDCYGTAKIQILFGDTYTLNLRGNKTPLFLLCIHSPMAPCPGENLNKFYTCKKTIVVVA